MPPFWGYFYRVGYENRRLNGERDVTMSFVRYAKWAVALVGFGLCTQAMAEKPDYPDILFSGPGSGRFWRHGLRVHR
jgi:hypothetical protein